MTDVGQRKTISTFGEMYDDELCYSDTSYEVCSCPLLFLELVACGTEEVSIEPLELPEGCQPLLAGLEVGCLSRPITFGR